MLSKIISDVDAFVWGPVMLVLLVGTGIFLTIRCNFGLSSKFSECMLAIKYREVNERGEMSGGPMYTMKKAIKNKKLGAVLGWLFALFAVIASFGIGNMTQGNSISTAVHETFGISQGVVGAVITVLALMIIIGGIKSISKVSSIVVPVMAIFYIIAGIIVILGNISNLPTGLSMIFHMAFSVKAVGGALCGNIVASMMNAARYGVARGCFSNEAGMGSAAIGIVLFAFSTILGWEYHGEKAFEYLMGTHKFNMIYRIIFSLVAYVGATQTLELVWNFSDIANALMAIPNLICMLLLSGEIAKDVKEFQKIIEEEKAGKKR